MVTNNQISLAMLIALITATGCISRPDREVVVYTALDREFSEPIFTQFTRQTGITVRAKYDVESTKTVGLAEAILHERKRPRCDVFWNNEILHTLRLKEAGLLAPYASSRTDHFPKLVRATDGSWYGFAARARILLVNKDLVAQSEYPRSIRALADEKWQGRAGIAKPLFGTTATHAACLFAVWGETEAETFFHQVKQNAQILSGNKQVAVAVAEGRLAFGLTDTDDAMVEIERGSPVEIVYPDQADGEMGTLFIPNTLAMLRDSPHTDEAKSLIDYLLSAPVEEQLAAGPSAQIPLADDIKTAPRVATPQTVRPVKVDFAEAAKSWEAASKFLRATFTGE